MDAYLLTAYLTLFVGSIVYGRKLYGGWAAPICLGLVSPMIFGIVGGILTAYQMKLIDSVGAIVGFPHVSDGSPAIEGICTIVSALAAIAGLRFIAMREGVKVSANQESKAEKQPNQALQTTPVTRSVFEKTKAVDDQSRGV